MKKLLVILVLLLGLLALLFGVVMMVLPRVAKLDPIAVVGDALTGYGANSDRHKNAQQLPSPWDPMGDENRVIESIPFEDRSYPLFAEAAAMLEAAEARDILVAQPNEDGWDVTAAWVDSDEAQAIITVLIDAVAKPESGFPLSDVEGKIWDEARVKHGLEPFGGTATPQPVMIGVLLPAVGKSRLATRLLLADAAIARDAGDAERFIHDTEVAIGITRHGYRPAWLIQQLVNYATLAMVGSSIEDTLLEDPGFLNESVADRLEVALRAASEHGVHDLQTNGETMFLEDQIRRFVDGRGVFNGSNTVNAAAAMNAATGGPGPSSVVTEAINPDLLATLREAERWAAAAKRSAKPAYIPMTDYDDEIAAWENQPDSIPGRIGRLVAGVTSPAWPKAVAVNRLAEQQFTALRLALAAHRHRLRHGDPPLGLADIDDDLITFDPIDGFTGGPMQFRWRDGAPFVYTYGPDKDDDGGRHVLDDDGEPWMTISDELLETAPDGDFVLFPAQMP